MLTGELPDYAFFAPTYIVEARQIEKLQQSIASIRKLHPSAPIVILNDHSPMPIAQLLARFLAEHGARLLDVDQERRGAGEMHPYPYYFHHRISRYAVMIHDGCELRAALPPMAPRDFLFLWHFDRHHLWDTQPVPGQSNRTHSDEIKALIRRLPDDEIRAGLLRSYDEKHTWVGCWGSMSIMSHDFLTRLQSESRFLDLYPFIKTQRDRMCLESLVAVCCLQTLKSPIGPGHSLQGSYTADHDYVRYRGKYFIKHSFARAR